MGLPDSSRTALGSATRRKIVKDATASSTETAFVPWPGDAPKSFSHLPWVVELLKDPTWITFSTQSRNPAYQQRRTFFNHGLANDDMVSACLMQHRAPADHPISPSQLPTNPFTPRTLVKETRHFILLGPLAQGHPGISHGGLVATLMDEAQGSVVFAGLEYLKEHYPTPEALPKRRVVTLTLEVSYRRGVPTPGAVIVKAWIEKVEGRKLFTRAVLENGKGEVLIEGRGLFLEIVEKAKDATKL